MIETTTFKLKVEFITPLLGSQPGLNRAIQIAQSTGRVLPEDEYFSLADAENRGLTVFHRTPDGKPALLNYQVTGFLKEAGKVLNGINGIRNLKWKVSVYVFITPRFIPLIIPSGEEITQLERPLRAETMQGPRVAITSSEVAPMGTTFVCGLELINKSELNEETLRDLLDYGYSRGIGQWRSSGAFGNFRYDLERE